MSIVFARTVRAALPLSQAYTESDTMECALKGDGIEGPELQEATDLREALGEAIGHLEALLHAGPTVSIGWGWESLEPSTAWRAYCTARRYVEEGWSLDPDNTGSVVTVRHPADGGTFHIHCNT